MPKRNYQVSSRSNKRMRTRGYALTTAKNVLRIGMRAWKARKVARNAKFNNGRSKTVSKTKTARNRVMDTSNQHGLICRKLGIVRMFKYPQKMKTIGRYFYHVSKPQQIGNIQGQQSVNYLHQMFTRNMLIGANVTQARTNRDAWDVDPFEFNPFSAPGTNNLFPAPAPADVADNDRMFIKQVNAHYSVLSMNTLPQFATIYFLTPKHDTDVPPTDDWANIVDAKAKTAVGQVVGNLVTDANAATGRSAIVDWGSNPFHHREFKSHWKCLKSAKLILQPGEQIDLRVQFDYEKLINRQTFIDHRERNILKDITVVPLMITQSGLYGQATGPGATSSEPAYGRTRVGLMCNYHVTFAAVPKSRVSTNLTYTGGLVNNLVFDAAKFVDDTENIKQTALL